MATLLSRIAWAKFQFFVKNGIFLLQKYLYRIFGSNLKSGPQNGPLCQISAQLDKNKRTRILTWNDTKNGLMMSYLPPSDDVSKIFMAFERFVSEYHQAKFGCSWTTNKGETEGGTLCPPAYMVPKDPNLNRVREMSFLTGRGAPENWGDQVLFLRSKDFFKLKREDHLYFFKEIKYFVKHSWNSC